MFMVFIAAAGRIRPPTQIRIDVSDFAVQIPVKTSNRSSHLGLDSQAIISNSGNLDTDAHVIWKSLQEAVGQAVKKSNRLPGVGSDILKCVSPQGIRDALSSMQVPLMDSERRRDYVIERKRTFALELCPDPVQGCSGSRVVGAETRRNLGQDTNDGNGKTFEALDSSIAYSLASSGSEADPSSSALADLLLGGARAVQVTHGGERPPERQLEGITDSDRTTDMLRPAAGASRGISPDEAQAANFAGESYRDFVTAKSTGSGSGQSVRRQGQDVNLREHFTSNSGAGPLAGMDGASAGAHSDNANTAPEQLVSSQHSLPAWALDPTYLPRYLGSGAINSGTFTSMQSLALLAASGMMDRGEFASAERQLHDAALQDERFPALLHNLAIATTFRMLQNQVLDLKSRGEAYFRSQSQTDATTGSHSKSPIRRSQPVAAIHRSIGLLPYGLLQYIKQLLAASVSQAGSVQRGERHPYFHAGNLQHKADAANQEAEGAYAIGWILELSGFDYEAAGWYSRAIDAAGNDAPSLTGRAFARLQSSSPEVVPVVAVGGGPAGPSHLQVAEDARRDACVSSEVVQSRGQGSGPADQIMRFALSDFERQILPEGGPSKLPVGLKASSVLSPTFLDIGQVTTPAAVLHLEEARARLVGLVKRPLVLDVGAHSGRFAARAAKLGAQVIAMEPVPSSGRLLEATMRLNGLGTADVSSHSEDSQAQAYHGKVQAACDLAAGLMANTSIVSMFKSEAVQQAARVLQDHPAAALQLRWVAGLAQSMHRWSMELPRTDLKAMTGSAAPSAGILLASVVSLIRRGASLASDAQDPGHSALCAVWRGLRAPGSEVAHALVGSLQGTYKLSDIMDPAGTGKSNDRFSGLQWILRSVHSAGYGYAGGLNSGAHSVFSRHHLASVSTVTEAVAAQCPELPSDWIPSDAEILLAFVLSSGEGILGSMPLLSAIGRYPIDLHDAAAVVAWPSNAACDKVLSAPSSSSSRADITTQCAEAGARLVAHWQWQLARHLQGALQLKDMELTRSLRYVPMALHRARLGQALRKMQSLETTRENISGLSSTLSRSIALRCKQLLLPSSSESCGYGTVMSLYVAAGTDHGTSLRGIELASSAQHPQELATLDTSGELSHHPWCKPDASPESLLAMSVDQTIHAENETALWRQLQAAEAKLFSSPGLREALTQSVMATNGCSRIVWRGSACSAQAHVVAPGTVAGLAGRTDGSSTMMQLLAKGSTQEGSANAAPSASFSFDLKGQRSLVDVPTTSIADPLRLEWFGRSAASLVASGHVGWTKTQELVPDWLEQSMAGNGAIRQAVPDVIRIDAQGCEAEVLLGYFRAFGGRSGHSRQMPEFAEVKVDDVKNEHQLQGTTVGSGAVAATGTGAWHLLLKSLRASLYAEAVERITDAMVQNATLEHAKTSDGAFYKPSHSELLGFLDIAVGKVLKSGDLSLGLSTAGEAFMPSAGDWAQVPRIARLLESESIYRDSSSPDAGINASRSAASAFRLQGPLPPVGAGMQAALKRAIMLGALGLESGQSTTAGSREQPGAPPLVETLRGAGLSQGTHWSVRTCPALWSRCGTGLGDWQGHGGTSNVGSPTGRQFPSALLDAWGLFSELGYMVVAVGGPGSPSHAALSVLPAEVRQGIIALRHKFVGEISVLVPPAQAGRFGWVQPGVGSPPQGSVDGHTASLDLAPDGLVFALEQVLRGPAAGVEASAACLDLWMIPPSDSEPYLSTIESELARRRSLLEARAAEN